MGKISAIIEFAIVAEEVVETVSDFFSGTVSSEFYEMMNKFAFLTTDFIGINSLGGFSGGALNISKAIINLSHIFLWGLLLFYAFRSLFSYFISKKVDMPWKTFVRAIIFVVLINASYFICFSGIFFSENVTAYIREFAGKDIVSFENFEETINEISVDEENDIFNVEVFSVIAGYFSIFLIFVFLGARFLMLKILILVAPLFFCFGVFKSTEKVFYSWIKIFISLLFFEILICLMLFIINELKSYDMLFFNIEICAMGMLVLKIFSNVLKFSIN